MKLDLSWFKFTGLSAVQNAAHAILGVAGGNVVNAWSLDWAQAGGIGLGAALVSILGSVVAYKMPNGPTEVVSAAASLSTAANLEDTGKHAQKT